MITLRRVFSAENNASTECLILEKLNLLLHAISIYIMYEIMDMCKLQGELEEKNFVVPRFLYIYLYR